MYIAKYYTKVQKWVPAINRLKFIVENYDKTIFIEEALHRLIEIHYHLGLEDEARKYASLLGTIIIAVNGINSHIKYLTKITKLLH